jgi:hypothetical protein
VDDEDAPPAIADRAPSDVAKRIAYGHARSEHFADREPDDLAQLIQDIIDRGESVSYGARTMYWDDQEQVVVIVNPRDPDGGTAFPSYREFFDDWGRPVGRQRS